jgi:hypothetical protein
MKFLLIVMALSLAVVSCNKKEEAPAAEGIVEGASAPAAHDKEHHHVNEGGDHNHEEAHHGDHDHKAHHPEHDVEAPQDPHNQPAQ